MNVWFVVCLCQRVCVYVNSGFEVQKKTRTFFLLLLVKYSISISIVDDALLGYSLSTLGVEDCCADLVCLSLFIAAMEVFL